jgi:hypothetical protein
VNVSLAGFPVSSVSDPDPAIFLNADPAPDQGFALFWKYKFYIFFSIFKLSVMFLLRFFKHR